MSQPTFRDFYGALDIAQDATLDQIEHAFRVKVKQWHPDLYASKSDEEQRRASDMMCLLTRAREILTDPKRRPLYDRDWKIWKQTGSAPQPKPSATPGFTPQNIQDIFQAVVGVLHAPVEVTTIGGDGKPLKGGMTLVQALCNVEVQLQRLNSSLEGGIGPDNEEFDGLLDAIWGFELDDGTDVPGIHEMMEAQYLGRAKPRRRKTKKKPKKK